ncbi:MAG: agmatine deiminase family protein, partial [Deltaproteobacteria bacterium]|nr:agmatine deiminase family protein [Deltaproteobacteria bacterium]
PLVAPDKSIAFTDLRYYPNRVYDDAVPTRLAWEWGITVYRGPMDYEGGNFQMDEAGTCYTTTGAFQENPDKTEAEVKDVMSKYLGCRSFIVLYPLQDGTTHMDMFSKLTNKNTFVLGKCGTADCSTATVNTLEDDFDILSAATLADGTKLTIHRIPMPYQKNGVWRTYTNSTMANGVNLYPAYAKYDDHQAEAQGVWDDALPGWDNVPIESEDIIGSGGAMHCISRNVPKGTMTKWIADGDCQGGKCVPPAGGYDGGCTTDAGCVGPDWVCSLNDCGGTTPVDCGDVTEAGCCEGSMLKYRWEGSLHTQACNAAGGCGWNPNDLWYDCGYSGSDPGGTPRACGACTPACDGKECGPDGCGGACGGCGANETCQAGVCVGCEPQCDGRECGSDGCSGVCGLCGDGQECANGKCTTPADPCNGITIEGCCAGNVNWWCEEGKLRSETCDAQNPCGWYVPGGQNVSGYYCGGSGEDPAGKFPLACPDCEGSCAGKECGGDGCGGSCGECTGGLVCDATGHCGADPCEGITVQGCCEETSGGGFVNKWCDGEKLVEGACGSGDLPAGCGWATPGGGNPDGYYCGGEGEDPAGEFPFACGSGPLPDVGPEPKPDTSEAAQPDATPETTPDGSEAVTPDAGSEGVVPDSTPTELVGDVICQPQCTERVCGSDGCGGTCGSCPATYQCGVAGRCVPKAGGDEGGNPDAVDPDAVQVDTGAGSTSSGGCTAGGPAGAAATVVPFLLALAAIRRRAR